MTTPTASRRGRQPLPIDECLFGPDRVCPIRKVILSSPSSSLSQQEEVVVAISPASSPKRRDPATISPASTSGMDDLEDGRWNAAKYTPERPGSNKESTIQPHIISLPDLRRLASQGIDDKGSWRGVAWRVLLRYLPPDTSQWNTTLEDHRSLYRSLVTELFDSPDELYKGNELRGHHGKRAKKTTKRAISTSSCSTSGSLEEEVGQEYSDESTQQQQKAIASDIAATGPNQTTFRRSHSDVAAITSAANKQPPTPIGLETPPRRPRSNSIGGTTPEDVGRNERRLMLLMEGASLTSTTDASGTTERGSAELRISTSGLDSNSCRLESVPARVRDEWKRSGRDTAALAGMMMRGGLYNHGVINTLLVTDHHAKYSPQSKSKHPPRQESINATSKSSHHNDDDDDDDDHSKWYQFFENASLLDEIRKDVVRTHPDLYFFLEPDQNLGQRRYAALERILFVWAKLNKGVRYVQGMNEIVGTLYYVLANDLNEEWACEAEADAYFLFNMLMIEMRDVFVPALDDADTGIQGRIANMSALLACHDPEVSFHLTDCGIDASFYAIRWLTTLLSREFLLPDTIRLWDSMFASTHKDNFLRYVCVTMVMMIREDLLKGDFSTCLRLLQSYPPSNLDQLLESSRALWIYESQITMACHKGGVSLHQALSTITPPPAIVMAYGLKGGVAMRHVMLEQEDKPNANTTSSLNSIQASGRSILQGARGFLGGLGREAANTRRSRSSNSS